MFKRKCVGCGKKVERKFSYCPYCGISFKGASEQSDFGMIGREDSSGEVREELKLPFGMGRMVESLVKQLEKQMNNIDGMDGRPQAGVPKGFQVRISSGKPQARQQVVRETPKIEVSDISEKEENRRNGLPKADAKSRVRRLADRIIYEIVAPGVRSKGDVVVRELATGLEILVYTKDKCYVKFIPLKVEIIGYSVRDEKVFVEIKN